MPEQLLQTDTQLNLTAPVARIITDDQHQIRQDIEQTRESLTEKLEVLEYEVKETIADAKDTVTGTIETAKQTVEDITSNVKETVQDTVATVKRTFDLPYQVNQHPWGMIGGS